MESRGRIMANLWVHLHLELLLHPKKRLGEDPLVPGIVCHQILTLFF